MPTLACPGPRRAAARRLAFALALCVALQGLAGAVIGALGRLHTHAPTAAPATIVLDDLRRGPIAVRTVADAAAERHGHAHAGQAAMRHHHAGDDASVEPAGAEPPSLDAEDAPAGTALSPLVALVSGAPAWLARTLAERPRPARGWVPLTHHPEPLERPPRPT